MSTDLLFEHFDTFATAPDGIARLREMILQLAVQGKLGTQDENDEPASVLLERLKKSEKINKKCKSTKIDESQEEDFPYLIPKNWIWIKFNEIVIDVQSGFACGERDSRGIVQLRMNNINPRGDFIWDKILRVPFDEVLKQKYELKSGDVVFNNTNSLELVGKSGLFKGFTEPIVYSNHFTRLRFDESSIDPAYVTIWLHYQWNSKIFEKICNKWIGQAAVNGTKLLTFLFPLPPTAEQHRIVEKVDRLMSLCDELEVKQQRKRAGCLKLGNASLAGLQNAESPEEFERLWAQVCDAFELILDCPENVDILRQTILQLAVQGRLVRQDPDDEPGITLIEKIRRERKQQVKGRKIEFQQPLASIKEKKITYSIPATWIWIRLGETIESMANGIYKPEIFYSNDGIACLRMYNINSGEINFKNLKKMELTDREIDQYLLKKGDLLVNRVNSRELVGKAAVIPDLQEPMIFESKNIRVRFNNHLILPDFVNILFQTKDVLQSWQGKAKQTCGQASVSQPQIAEIYTPLPPLAEQYRIVEKVKTMMVLLDKLEKRLKEGFNIQNRLAEAFVIDIDYLN